MSATYSRTYRGFVDDYSADAFPMCGAYLIEWQRQMNCAWAESLAPCPVPGWSWLNGAPGTSFAFAPDDTSERYCFPLILLAPNGYKTLGIAASTITTAGTNTATLKLYVDVQRYVGPSTGTWTASYLSPSVVSASTTVTTTATNWITTLALPEVAQKPTGYSVLHGIVTMKAIAYTAGDVHRLRSLSCKVLP